VTAAHTLSRTYQKPRMAVDELRKIRDSRDLLSRKRIHPVLPSQAGKIEVKDV
jgi:hypothetical protein